MTNLPSDVGVQGWFDVHMFSKASALVCIACREDLVQSKTYAQLRHAIYNAPRKLATSELRDFFVMYR